MFFASGRSKPSPYPLLPFHIIRTCQLLSSLITAGILIYFVWHLRDEHYPVPWTFIFLLSASLFTLPLFIITHHIHHTAPYTSPKRLFFFNLPLSLLWLLGLALLTWNLTWTLGHRCTLAQWQNGTGIMVCRMYKALTSFAVTGSAATIGAAVLDWRVWRGEEVGGGGRGGYGMMRLPGESQKARDGEGTGGLKDAKAKIQNHLFWRGSNNHNTNNISNTDLSGDIGTGKGRTTATATAMGTTPPPPSFSPYAGGAEGVSEGEADMRGGALWDGEQQGLTRPWRATKTLEAKDFGYHIPEGQMSYSGYAGAGERGNSMDICQR